MYTYIVHNQNCTHCNMLLKAYLNYNCFPLNDQYGDFHIIVNKVIDVVKLHNKFH